MKPVVSIAQLAKRYASGQEALKDVSLDIAKGEIFALLGPNGAGKTTTVRMLTALIEATEGTATVDGVDIRERPDEVRARVGILTETPGLYDKLSARANLDFFGRLYDLDAAARGAAIEHWLRLFGLWERADDVAGTFSKGMRQKLAIARALLHDPAVVFLDEPTAALDPEAEHVLFDRFAVASRKAAARTGGITVLVSHRFSTVRMADLIVVMHDGRVAEFGPHEALLRDGGRYAELFELQARAYR